ncbi:hypothetical protein [Lysinibacillus sp. BPa_S21]|uniref:hypothetical protein n=1 Tax=Lysinibacillus sp. BPa_S21 TaxID=2932478 RepID=UPI0020111AF9|nr:hypothetical protein [Lysinibacillus sp. BPa_S21]
MEGEEKRVLPKLNSTDKAKIVGSCAYPGNYFLFPNLKKLLVRQIKNIMVFDAIGFL